MDKHEGENRLYRPRTFTPQAKQRFARQRTAALITHVGGRPSNAQLILIGRIVRNEWDLFRLDAQMDVAELSPHAMRTRLAMENRLRLDLRDLGLREGGRREPTLADLLARHAEAATA